MSRVMMRRRWFSLRSYSLHQFTYAIRFLFPNYQRTGAILVHYTNALAMHVQRTICKTIKKLIVAD